MKHFLSKSTGAIWFVVRTLAQHSVLLWSLGWAPLWRLDWALPHWETEILSPPD